MRGRYCRCYVLKCSVQFLSGVTGGTDFSLLTLLHSLSPETKLNSFFPLHNVQISLHSIVSSHSCARHVISSYLLYHLFHFFSCSILDYLSFIDFDGTFDVSYIYGKPNVVETNGDDEDPDHLIFLQM